MGFSAGVDVAMGLQPCELGESLAAINANMWLLSGMQFLVAFEISLPLEGFVTIFAHPLSRHGRDFNNYELLRMNETGNPLTMACVKFESRL